MPFEVLGNKCPGCSEELRTPAEMAAHKCKVGTDEEIAGYSLEESIAKARRAAIKPTQAKLEQDSASIVQQLHDCWDGEVGCIIILVPKDNPSKISWGTNIPKRDHVKQILEAVKKSSVSMNDRRPVLQDAQGVKPS